MAATDRLRRTISGHKDRYHSPRGRGNRACMPVMIQFRAAQYIVCRFG